MTTSNGVSGSQDDIPADQSQPFFLYFAFQHTHQPQFASEQFTNSTLRGPFGDSLANLDWAVGEVMSTLKLSDLEENTLVFFTSDNGCVSLLLCSLYCL